MDVKATLEDKISKDGKPYKCIEIQITPTYKKVVFLQQAELELLALNDKNKKTDMPFK